MEKSTKVNESNNDRKIITISYNLSNYANDEANYFDLILNNETLNKHSIGYFLTKLSYINDNIIDILHDINRILSKKNINMTVSLASSYMLSDIDMNIFSCFEKYMYDKIRIRPLYVYISKNRTW